MQRCLREDGVEVNVDDVAVAEEERSVPAVSNRGLGLRSNVEVVGVLSHVHIESDQLAATRVGECGAVGVIRHEGGRHSKREGRTVSSLPIYCESLSLVRRRWLL